MKTRIFFLMIVAFGFVQGVQAQAEVHDSVDVLHYDLALDMGHLVTKQLRGEAEITFVKTRECSRVTFDLIADSIHPVWLDGAVTRGFDFDRDNRLVTVYVGGQPGDTHVVRITYFSNGYVESYGFGGLHMDNGLHYNLGAVFMESPHCFGRSLYPCRDNFHDKATYTYRVTSQPGWRSLCSGLLTSSTTNADGSLTETWELTHPSPTYISSVSSAPWHIIETSYPGVEGSYPATLGYLNHDSTQVVQHFAMLSDVLPMFERCFGPYRWERIGYIATPYGSMEHAQNIALVSQCMAASDLRCEMTTCHELAHAWFGNLITCTTQGDMWINEGGASFCEEVANEAIYGRASSVAYYQEMLRAVLLNAHQSDGGYRALHDMPQQYTYGTTTYKKGALVWHSLRGLMGDSLFYASMRRLFANCAFGNLDAYVLRDSLSLYSGKDLTGFFDFHVFNPGFVDYESYFETDGHQGFLRIRQHLRGTEQYPQNCQVPVTFLALNGTPVHKEWFTIDDTLTVLPLTLPAGACRAVVDYDHELSDACTDGFASIKSRGTKDLEAACFKVSASSATTANSPWVFAGHHYVAPEGPMPNAVVRAAKRWWQVTGVLPADTSVSVTGFFQYTMGSGNGKGAKALDDGFYTNYRSLDSIYLLYRPGMDSPWQVVTNARSASSTISNGYLKKTCLLEGEYTLAVVDTALLTDTDWLSADLTGRNENHPTLRISPNPTGTEFRVEMGASEKKMRLSVYDIKGRKVLEKNGVSNGDIVRHHLPAGTYLVLIQNKFVSLQSQIVVQ